VLDPRVRYTTRRPAAARRPRDDRRGGRAGLLIVTSVAGRWQPIPYGAQRLDEMFGGPGLRHWLGTDHLGRDILTRVAYGGGISFLVSGAAVLVQSVIGVAVGLTAGYFGGRTDATLMRLTDVILAFPPLLLLLLVTGLFGPTLLNIVPALACFRVGGHGPADPGGGAHAPDPRLRGRRPRARRDGRVIIRRHLLANIATVALVRASLDIGPVILSESTLSFLGIGIQPPTPSWGAMIAEGFAHLRAHPALTVIPSVALSLAVLSMTFVGDGLTEALDPRQRRR
jgi:ABC-type dipeptide/oligopeptide/nickel transport system permease subunit